MASPYNFDQDAGADLRKTFRWTTPRRDNNGVVVRDAKGQPIYDPVDNTGWTALGQVRDRVDGTLLATLGTADVVARDGDVLFDGPTGKFMVVLPAPKTEIFRKYAKVVYDIQVTKPTGDKVRLLEGTITVDPGVTK